MRRKRPQPSRFAKIRLHHSKPALRSHSRHRPSVPQSTILFILRYADFHFHNRLYVGWKLSAAELSLYPHFCKWTLQATDAFDFAIHFSGDHVPHHFKVTD